MPGCLFKNKNRLKPYSLLWGRSLNLPNILNTNKADFLEYYLYFDNNLEIWNCVIYYLNLKVNRKIYTSLIEDYNIPMAGNDFLLFVNPGDNVANGFDIEKLEKLETTDSYFLRQKRMCRSF